MTTELAEPTQTPEGDTRYCDLEIEIEQLDDETKAVVLRDADEKEVYAFGRNELPVIIERLFQLYTNGPAWNDSTDHLARGRALLDTLGKHHTVNADQYIAMVTGNDPNVAEARAYNATLVPPVGITQADRDRMPFVPDEDTQG